jgi:hypothetical protein
MIRNRILERRVPPKNPLFAGLNPALINKSGKSKPTGDAERQSIVLSTLLPAHGSQQLDSRFNALGNFSARTRPTLIGCGARYGLPRKSTSASPPAATPRKHLHGWFRSPPAIAEPSMRCRRVVPNFSADCCKQATTRQSGGLRSRCPGPNRQPTLDRGDSLLGGRMIRNAPASEITN